MLIIAVVVVAACHNLYRISMLCERNISRAQKAMNGVAKKIKLKEEEGKEERRKKLPMYSVGERERERKRYRELAN